MNNKKFKLVFLTGAGISQPSGIPTFRDEYNKEGLWNNHPVNEVATLTAFINNPQKVSDFMRELFLSVSDKRPNRAHYALAELEKHYEVIILTQNIDDLHERAGSTNVIHLHGKLDEHHCLNPGCRHVWHSTDHIKHGVSQCPACASFDIKYNVTLFLENLDFQKMEYASSVVHEADLFIQIGTSALIQPVCNISKHALPRRKRVEMNLRRSMPKNTHYFQHYYIGDIIKTIDQFVFDIPELLPKCTRKKYEFSGILKDKERYNKNNRKFFIAE